MKVYLFILSLFFCGVTYAQNSVTGAVTDSNKQPIPGANIKISGDSAGTITDNDGNFSLSTAKQPPFTIEVSSVGYGAKTVSITSVNQKVTVVLADEETKLNEIVVSASRTPERVIESPVTIERMNLQQIKTTTAASYYDGLENLKEVHFNTSSLSFKSINTRGFSTVANTRFMQLVDGMDNSSPALNFVLGNLIGISELDVANVELLPGASSALYGANAFNGILFMNSKSPFTSPGISTYVKYGQTTQDVAGTNDYWDVGVRAATVFAPWFAAKANFTFLKATEWIAADDRNVQDAGVLTNPDAIGHTRNLNYDGLNVYGDEASTNIKDVGRILADRGLLPNPALVNLLPDTNVSRTGYREQDMSDNKIKNVKADFSLHFKPWTNKNIEFIVQSKIGTGNTIYQGANRYYLKNFYMNQNKLELKGDNFFWRVYMTDEDAGDSYDMRFAALAVNNKWRDNSTWFGTYAGAYIQSTLAGQGTAASHAIARMAADAGRFLPGSTDFNKALATVIDDPNLQTGSKFIDHSKLYHSDLNYNFKNQIKFAEIQVGGSYRIYEMNSEGTIFTDFDGPIKYNEYGAYAQMVKKFAADRLKFTGSVRYDKSENFKGFFSPRVALVYSAGATKVHNFRISYQTGFRNPTTQDQYIGLDLGPYALIGSAPDNLTRYTETRTVSQAGIDAGNPAQVTLNGAMAYNNSFTIPSVKEYQATGNAAVLQRANINLVKPERVQAIELGYRSVIKNDLSVDINGYYNIYNDFLNQSRVYTPLYGTVGTASAVDAVDNNDLRTFQVYSNSKTKVTSVGFGIGLSKKVYKDFEVGVSYNHAQFEYDEAKDPDFIPGFNTPKHRVKGMLGNDRIVKTSAFQLGFNTNVRWSNEYLWQSSFADGMVPENTVVDAQLSFGFPKIKSLLKVGANNLGGKDYTQVIGAGKIGQQWYASITINP
jgi:outer membrane receptor protein involved in Fe transport